jgi:hypothetical protein
VFYGALWLTNHEIFMGNNLKKMNIYEDHQEYGVWNFEILTKVLKRAKNKYLWNVTITEKYHLLPAVRFICSFQYEATFSTVTERTEADILCAVKC